MRTRKMRRNAQKKAIKKEQRETVRIGSNSHRTACFQELNTNELFSVVLVRNGGWGGIRTLGTLRYT